MILKDLLKEGQNVIDAGKLFSADGKVNEEVLELLGEEKPIIPPVPFERKKLLSIKENRDRMLVFPDRLPTRNLMPFPVDAHEQIGEYESKHNLYLLLAVSYNSILERVEKLEKELLVLKSNSK